MDSPSFKELCILNCFHGVSDPRGMHRRYSKANLVSSCSAPLLETVPSVVRCGPGYKGLLQSQQNYWIFYIPVPASRQINRGKEAGVGGAGSRQLNRVQSPQTLVTCVSMLPAGLRGWRLDAADCRGCARPLVDRQAHCRKPRSQGPGQPPRARSIQSGEAEK